MIVIDTEVYAIDMIYIRDQRFGENRAFLDGLAGVDKAITIYNLMEIVGKASFVLNLDDLKVLYRGFGMTYGVTTLFPRTDDRTASEFLEEMLKGTFAKICERMSFLDALILDTAEAHPQVRSFVSWNARHFEGKECRATSRTVRSARGRTVSFRSRQRGRPNHLKPLQRKEQKLCEA